ncbi:MAG: hypothetical protein AXA67_01520 [Methylothermaceae bacteria B42]|nr:MAG: hypothetical protein AXA67_01520 [Methylothermaceae bacteria B42]
MKYMSRAGYDPQGAVTLQKTFVELAKGRRRNWLTGLLASHPPSQERVENNMRTAATLPKGGIIGVKRFRQKLAHLKRVKPAYDAYGKGRKALAEGDLSQALRLANKAIQIEPKEGHFCALLGDIEGKRQNFRAAKRHFDKAIRLNGDFFYYYLKRALLNKYLDNTLAAHRYCLLPWRSIVGRGKSSRKSLVNPRGGNPGQYLRLRTGVDLFGRLKAEISNPTQHDMRGVVIAVQYQDARGHSRQFKRRLFGVLLAGRTRYINLGLRNLPAKRLRTVRTQVISARIAR